MPVDRFPFVTVALMVANVVVYVVGNRSYGAVPGALTAGTVFSAMFFHPRVIQLIVNLWFLWLFGNNVEDSTGPLRFLIFYIAGGVAALGVQLAVAPNSSAPTMGAAGAISAVIGGYLVLYWRARVITLVLIPFFSGVAEVPVPVLVAVWIGAQCAFAAAGWIDPAGGAVAYLSWIGGMALGLIIMRPLARRRKPVPPAAPLLR